MFPNNKKEQLIIGILIIVGFIVLSVKHNSSTVEPAHATKEVVASDSPTSTIEKVTTLGMNFQTFCEKYNEQASRHEVPQILIKKITTEKGKDRDTVYCYFGSSVALGIDIDKDKNVLEVTVFSEPAKGGRQAGFYQGLAFDSIIAIFDPQFTRNERNDILRKFISDMKHYAVSSGRYRYETRLYNGILMFSVKPKS